jgi:hypothetical protein
VLAPSSGSSALDGVAGRCAWPGGLQSCKSAGGALFGRLENLKRAHESVVNAHHRAGIIEFAAVVGRRKQRDQLPFCKELVAVFHHLVRATDQVQIVPLQELGNNVGAEREADSTVVVTPSRNVFIGVAPQQVAQQARVGHVSRPHDALDLLERIEIRTKTAVHAKNLLVDHGGNGHTVEAVGERLPYFDVVPPLAFVKEPIDLVDGRALVVATKEKEVFRKLNLEGKEQTYRFQRLLATVNIVPKEQVI